MPRHISVENSGGLWSDEMPGASGATNGVAQSVVLAGSAFVLGLAVGIVIRDQARQLFERARRALWHREYERTVTYDDNLPEALSRREPAPYEGQPRFGGTGAIGVSPATVVAPRREEPRDL